MSAYDPSGHTLSPFDTVRYPVEIGLVPSLNQPGGNVTGMAIFDASLCTKRLEFVPMTGATSIVERDRPIGLGR